MRRIGSILVFLIAIPIGACGGGSGSDAYVAKSASSERAGGAPSQATASLDEPSSGASYLPEPRVMREERPGLGTAFGERRTSHVREISFEREATPFSELPLYYNDRRGVELQASRLHVEPRYEREYATGNGSIWVSIRDEGGQGYDTTTIGGRTYVIGREGERYSIHLRSRSPEEVEVVMSVDGLDVIDGTPASYSHRGYLLMPYATLDIEGFRRNQDSVAAFRFAPTSDSYAERKGEGRNVGVIGLAFFREAHRGYPFARPDYSDDELDKRNSADPFPRRYATPPPNW